MNEQNTKELVDIFPELFEDLDPRTPPAPFTFDCGDGWFSLLKELLKELKEVSIKKNFPIKCFKAKETFGTLRFYTDGYECCVGDAIDKAVLRSSKTCEKCGEPAELRKRRSWYTTQCKKCWRVDCERYPKDIK